MGTIIWGWRTKEVKGKKDVGKKWTNETGKREWIMYFCS